MKKYLKISLYTATLLSNTLLATEIIELDALTV